VISDHHDHEYIRLCYFLLIGAALELVFFAVVSLIMRYKTGFRLLDPMLAVFQLHTEYVVFIIFAIGHITSDVFLAYMKKLSS
jgi:hypothetical protein